MSPRFAFPIISLLVFVTGACLAQENQDRPAEAVFKNIQSFKGQPASAILPAMQFMCGSLKVDCDYCHVSDRASDEKRAKGTARMMIAMTRDINDKNFGGRMQVTCATCHGGHAHPQGLPPVEGTDIRQRRSADVSPDKVIAVYAAALGQDASKVTSIQLSGTESADGKTSPTTFVVSGTKFLFTGSRTFGYDGTTMWYKTPDGSAPIPPDVQANFLLQFALYVSPDALPHLDRASGGTATIDGHDVVSLSGTISGQKTRATLYFDKASGLLRQATYITPTILGGLPTVVDYNDYRKVSGVQIPTSIEVHTDGPDLVRRFKSIKVNAPVSDSMFKGG